MKHINKNHENKKNSTVYTPECITEFLHRMIIPHIQKSGDSLKVFDPAIGKGALTKQLKSNGAYVIGNDIEDVSKYGVQADDLYQGDFEKFDKSLGDIDLVIVNPPFNGHPSKKLYPEVFLDKIFELCGYDIPTIIITPSALRNNQDIKSKRFRKMRDIYGQITSTITLPLNIFDEVAIPTEILIFNIEGLQPHYFLDNIFLDKAQVKPKQVKTCDFVIDESIKIHNDDVLKVMKSMSDESVDLVVTDPPYKIATGGCKVNGDTSKNPSGMLNRGIPANDLKSKWINKSNVEFIRSGSLFKHNKIKFSDWMPEVFRVLKNQTHAYFMVNDRNLNELMTEAIKAGFKLQNVLVWKKNNATPNKYYMKNCEFIVMCRKGKAKNITNMGTKNILEVNNIIGSKTHPTEKPVELLEILIRNSSKQGDVVFEPFLGTGSTLVAAQNLGRNGIGVEVDEQYFEIAQKRLQPVYEELKQAA